MSSLSASAAVFVPGRSWQPAPGPVSSAAAARTDVQPQQFTSAGPAEFVPGKPWAGGDGLNSGQPQQWSNGEEQYQAQYANRSQEPQSIQLVRDVLGSLNSNPGMFEDLMHSLVARLNSTIVSDDELSAIASIIFEQSVSEPNFRYTGARACDYLTVHLKLPPPIKTFRVHINQRVKDPVERREQMAKDPRQMGRLHGATMFLAELFLNTEVEGKRIAIYRTALTELMDTLVKNASDENLKCLGQLLKLSGKEIEDYDNAQNQSTVSKTLNEIFNEARRQTTRDTMDKGIRVLWLQLFELRGAKWGQAEVKYNSSSGPPGVAGGNVCMAAGGDAPPSTAEFTNEPVFYNNQGQVITAAEAGFGDELDAEYDNYTCYDESAVDPYADYDLDPSHYQPDANEGLDYADDLDELDAEIQAAFSDFLIESGQGAPS
ncbi:polyadenylate-binding protein-interacting protein 1-like [Asterias rubens]|uniref:polyadenylate-binding protein-interacting protein 1-like n=1 Tax=Asterias rubens TaxID=7604 RepID=UPI001455CD99|nr:polyadenylate-binding protein-interacting protein 1-like [Asterias rubens]